MKETETLIKRVIPYLSRRGYEIENNMFFEESIKCGDKTMFQDILIKKSKPSTKTLFVIEVKRDTLKLEQKHINQAIKYGENSSVPFVVVTNGIEFRLYNVKTKKRIAFNGMMLSKIPSYIDLETVLKYFKNNPELDDITLTDKSLPFRPTVSASQLEELLKRCHNIIRNVEKDETHIFGDLSKLIFLKLLEEKRDAGELPEDIPFPLAKSFNELASEKNDELVMQTIRTAINQIFTHAKFKDLAPIASGDEEATGHEGVSYKALLYIKNKSTYKKLITELSKVHFMDAEVDVKGSVFEYFIRATLQGRKGLGQYFTPRPIILFMCEIANIRKLLRRMALTGVIPKVVDPACGSGGFLIYSLSAFLKYLEEEYKGSLTKKDYQDLVNRIKQQIFYGQDANQSIVVAAKMNMIIAGDGSSNIYQGNTLAFDNKDKLSKPNLIITNPPFGSSESDSLDEDDLDKYDIKTTTAQSLFIQHMIDMVDEEGEILTVIDESILNAPKWKQVREFIMNKSCIEAIVSLPKAAFSPNKINVKTSILYLKKKEGTNPEDYIQDYPIRVIDLNEIGYNKRGDIISPGMDEVVKVIKDRWAEMQHSPISSEDTGGYFSSYPLTMKQIHLDCNPNLRFDYKFHNPELLSEIDELKSVDGARPLTELCIPTSPDEYTRIEEKGGIPILFKRGKTPKKACYNVPGATVRMIKAGNIGKTGPQEGAGIDFVSEELAISLESYRAKKNDVLLASTGEGTLGKSMVVNGDLIGGLVDGHVTIIRLREDIDLLPQFVTWFLRSNLGQRQIERLYIGSTGQIELTERDAEEIVIPVPSIEIQEDYINRCQELVLKAESLRKEAEKAVSDLSLYTPLSQN